MQRLGNQLERNTEVVAYNSQDRFLVPQLKENIEQKGSMLTQHIVKERSQSVSYQISSAADAATGAAKANITSELNDHANKCIEQSLEHSNEVIKSNMETNASLLEGKIVLEATEKIWLIMEESRTEYLTKADSA